MFHYPAFGHTLLSDVPFGELDQREPSGNNPPIRIETGPVVDTLSSLRYECLWPSGERYFASYGEGSRYVLHFPNVCGVAVDVGRSVVRVSPLPQVPLEAVTHVLLNQVVPRLIAAMGRVVLHASAVETPLGTVAFLGEGGAGKSTLAAVFSAAGHALVCDDALVVAVAEGRPWAVPGYPSLRLFPDAAGQLFESRDGAWLPHAAKKRRVRPPLRSSGLTPLRHLFVLDGESKGSTPRVEPIGQKEAFFALLRHAYRLDATTPEIIARDTNLYVGLLPQCAVSRLTLPDGLDTLPSARNWLLTRLERHAPCATATATL